MTDPVRLPRKDGLFLARCVFAGLIVVVFPLKSPRWLTTLGPEHYHPPLGPFALFESYPPSWLVVAIDLASLLVLAIWVTGWGKWIIGSVLTLLLTASSGFFYAAGKIDHDFVILLVPLLLTIPGISPKRALLFCLSVYFASAGFAKAIGGWLDLETQASLSWALTYAHAYQKTEPLLLWSLATWPGWTWEIIDQVTVWFELAVPLALLPRFLPFISLTVPLFHLGTVALFGIDFARLLLVYIPLAIICCVNRKRARPPLSRRTRSVLLALCWTGILIAVAHYRFRGFYGSIALPVDPPGLLLFPLFEVILAAAMLLHYRAHRQERLLRQAARGEPGQP